MSDTFDMSNISALYNENTCTFGKSAEALSQGSGDKMHIRYAACTDLITSDPKSTVLDVGCGFGETYEYLLQRGWNGTYIGLDIAEEPLRIARARHKFVQFLLGDVVSLFANCTHKFDYVIGISCFTLKLAHGDSTTYYQNTLRHMFSLSRKACILGGLMTTHVDYQKDIAWHADPSAWYDLGMKMTRAVSLVNYLPYEFALVLRRAQVTVDNTFFFEVL